MDDAAVAIGAPVAIDDARQEQAGDHEELGHAEGPRELDHVMHEALAAHGVPHPEGGVGGDDEDDADALGDVDPGDAGVVEAESTGRGDCFII